MLVLSHPAKPRPSRMLAAALPVFLTLGLALAASPIAHASATGVAPHRYGEIDCNGLSPIQRPVRITLPCADPTGYDGHYIGHDEPSIRFISGQPGSGDNVTWTERLGSDPSSAPTVSTPGHDVTHWLELSIAPWFSMALCDPRSYPQTACKPESDTNAPTACSGLRECLPGVAVLPTRHGTYRRRGQRRQHPLVLGDEHRQPGMHHEFRPLQPQLHRAGELRADPDQRGSRRPAKSPACRPGDLHPEREDPAHEPR